MSEVDEGLLYELFQHEMGRAGADINTINYIPFSEVRASFTNDYQATYTNIENIIRIDIPGQTHEDEDKAYRKLRILESLIHEETHAVAYTSHIITIRTEEQDTVRKILHIQQTGTESTMYELDSNNTWQEKMTIGTAVNEGITELIAQRVLHAYIERIPLPGTSRQDLDVFTRHINTCDSGGYARNVLSLKFFIALLAEATGVPRDVVENGMIRSYLRGAEFISDETAAYLDELLGKDMGLFLKTMAEAENTTETFENALFEADVKIPHDIAQKIVDEFYD